MNESWKFSDIPYTSPDVEALQTRYDALTRRARAARRVPPGTTGR